MLYKALAVLIKLIAFASDSELGNLVFKRQPLSLNAHNDVGI
jgi:hypothetical protein